MTNTKLSVPKTLHLHQSVYILSRALLCLQAIGGRISYLPGIADPGNEIDAIAPTSGTRNRVSFLNFG
ncbi:MAG: hypothetical protein AB4352_28660 [Hormoscilla sp.]